MPIITINTSELSAEQIERMYYLYHNNYSKIGGELLSKNEFVKKLTEYYETAIIYDDGNTIQNAILTRQTRFGRRVTLAFGENQLSSERIAMLKQALKEGCYAEAGGAVAKILLNDNSIKVSMLPASKHYSSHVANHGKKIIFGHHKNGVEIVPQARNFFVFLYEYKKIKLQNKQNKDALVELFKHIDRDNNITEIYKLILLSKIARSLSKVKHPNAVHWIEEVSARLINALLDKKSMNSFLVAQQQLSSEQRIFMSEILHNKSYASLIKNNLFLENIKKTNIPPSVSIKSKL